MNFNDRLADLRRKRGLSQEQLGYELGVSRQTVSKWELGSSIPNNLSTFPLVTCNFPNLQKRLIELFPPVK